MPSHHQGSLPLACPWTHMEAQTAREIVNSLLDTHPRSAICGIVCPNPPGRVAGLDVFRETRPVDVPRRMRVPCLNHMIDLLLTCALRTVPSPTVVPQLSEIIHALNAPKTLRSISSRCRTSFSIIEGLEFIGELMIPKRFARVHLSLVRFHWSHMRSRGPHNSSPRDFV
jgi:hypothetical protein